MADYTLTTTTEQETALTEVIGELNAERAKQTPPLPAVTNNQYVIKRFGDVFDNYVKQMEEKNQISIREAWGNADAATRARVKSELGI